MKAFLRETEYQVYIDHLPRLEWGEGFDTSFIRSAQLALNALGARYSYDYLMGLSGAAFRLHFHPDWCPSAGDMTTGFDVSKVLFSSLGYSTTLHSIDDNSFDDIRSLYQKIKEQINRGVPIVAINLKVCPEWGIITGYLKKRPGILCRTFFDETEEYSLAEHAPWLSFFIGDRSEPLHPEEIFKNSLKIAVQLGKTEDFEGYKSGRSAYKHWSKDLKNMALSLPKRGFEHHEVNLTLFNCLVDARKAAVSYLSSMNSAQKLRNGERIIKNYQDVVDLLTDIQDNLLPSFTAGPQNWSSEILLMQAQILEQVAEKETEIFTLMEEELEH